MSPRQQTDRPAPAHRQGSIDPVDPAAIDPEQVESASDEIKRTVGALMPWGLSIVVHAALVVLAFFLVWQTIDVKEEQPTVPRLTDVPAVVVHEPVEKMERASESAEAMLTPPVPEPTDVDVEVRVGIDRTHIVLPDPGNGRDRDGDEPDRKKPGDDEWFLPDNRFVFIIDASGSMVDVLPFVVDELKKSVNALDSTKRGTIILFSGEGVFEVPGGGGVKGLRPLTPRFKQQINDWVTLANHRFDTGGRGTAYAAAALDRGLSYNPQAVYLLSDNLTGGGQGATRHEILQDEIMKVVRSHSDATPPARIHTIQFLYEDPLVRAGLTGTLRLIADETGGTYQFKSQRDLNLR